VVYKDWVGFQEDGFEERVWERRIQDHENVRGDVDVESGWAEFFVRQCDTFRAPVAGASVRSNDRDGCCRPFRDPEYP
jgi:hypothetical protein